MDNGPEFIAQAIRDWCKATGSGTVYIEPGSPWENPFVESFNSRARDELFSREVFHSVLEGRVMYFNWCDRYNAKRPHSSIGYLPPGGLRGADCPGAVNCGACIAMIKVSTSWIERFPAPPPEIDPPRAHQDARNEVAATQDSPTDVDAIISTIVEADEVGIQLRSWPAAGFRKPELSLRVDPFFRGPVSYERPAVSNPTIAMSIPTVKKRAPTNLCHQSGY